MIHCPGGPLYREAVIQNSPGLQPCVYVARIRPESGGRGVSLGCSSYYSTGRPTSAATFRAPSKPPDPRLKPWAVMYSRFAARQSSPRTIPRPRNEDAIPPGVRSNLSRQVDPVPHFQIRFFLPQKARAQGPSFPSPDRTLGFQTQCNQ
jgi:hypothetical protein